MKIWLLAVALTGFSYFAARNFTHPPEEWQGVLVTVCLFLLIWRELRGYR